ncbi:hypothetical protein BpHYR1_029823 [Brachionus plicatilis]|uniref:Uncharacterized protein n=1 Tax=Brachionus plicatilis TaxID=10195 RepID=A0A3M7S8L9_BRAPC|nr:hypothetical protein BpHYR1_029823 [Brachionus plicatilis]
MNFNIYLEKKSSSIPNLTFLILNNKCSLASKQSWMNISYKSHSCIKLNKKIANEKKVSNIKFLSTLESLTKLIKQYFKDLIVNRSIISIINFNVIFVNLNELGAELVKSQTINSESHGLDFHFNNLDLKKAAKKTCSNDNPTVRITINSQKDVPFDIERRRHKLDFVFQISDEKAGSTWRGLGQSPGLGNRGLGQRDPRRSPRLGQIEN